ncbi:MAG: flagellin [Pirellulaceae bacterium]|jgi:flagellin
MSRINTNVSSLIAQKNLGRTNEGLQRALTRLSTGLRINDGKDDPAGLIASENLRSDIEGIRRAITNSERANQLIATADSGLGQVSNLLLDIRGLITEAANEGVLSDEQIAANQLQVDVSLTAINRIAQTTTFQGKKLLDGGLDFIIDSNPPTIQNVSIYQATLDDANQLDLDITINAGATQALLTVAAAGFPNAGSTLANDLVVQIGGVTGTEAFTFQAGASLEQVIDAINLVSDATGTTAANNAGVLELASVEYGTDAFVDVRVIEETGGTDFGAELSNFRGTGTDIDAIINGVTASGDGNRLSVNTSTLSLDITVSDGDSTNLAFTIDGGGALFQIGPDVVSNQQARLGIGSINTALLGSEAGRLFELLSGGNYDLTNDATTASRIINDTITKIASLRGRLGAFQRTTLQTNIVTLNDTLTSLVEAESTIRDANFAVETANLTRAQILVQSGTQVLSIANQNPQNVLALLQ